MDFYIGQVSDPPGPAAFRVIRRSGLVRRDVGGVGRQFVVVFPVEVDCALPRKIFREFKADERVDSAVRSAVSGGRGPGSGISGDISDSGGIADESAGGVFSGDLAGGVSVDPERVPVAPPGHPEESSRDTAADIPLEETFDMRRSRLDKAGQPAGVDAPADDSPRDPDIIDRAALDPARDETGEDLAVLEDSRYLTVPLRFRNIAVSPVLNRLASILRLVMTGIFSLSPIRVPVKSFLMVRNSGPEGIAISRLIR